jgi:uncharacterized protein YbaP (TraB family)
MQKVLLYSLLISVVNFIHNAHAQTLEKTLLWEISGNNLNTPSYLFGTIHIISKDKFVLDDIVKEKLISSQKFVAEIDLSDMAAQIKIMGKMQLDSNLTLKDLLSKEEYEFIKQVAKDTFGISLSVMKTMKPLFIQQSIISKGIIGNDFESYEMKLLEIAKKHKLKIGGLESLEDQMEALSSIPVRKQAQMLLESMKDINQSRKEMNQLMEMYLSKDVDAMYRKIHESDDYADFEGQLLTNRNANWIPRIVEMSSQGQVFYAVGAGHLAGDNGVIELLRKEGFTVKPILK